MINAVQILDSEAAKQPDRTVTIAIDFAEEGFRRHHGGCVVRSARANAIEDDAVEPEAASGRAGDLG